MVNLAIQCEVKMYSEVYEYVADNILMLIRCTKHDGILRGSNRPASVDHLGINGAKKLSGWIVPFDAKRKYQSLDPKGQKAFIHTYSWDFQYRWMFDHLPNKRPINHPVGWFIFNSIAWNMPLVAATGGGRFRVYWNTCDVDRDMLISRLANEFPFDRGCELDFDRAIKFIKESMPASEADYRNEYWRDREWAIEDDYIQSPEIWYESEHKFYKVMAWIFDNVLPRRTLPSKELTIDGVWKRVDEIWYGFRGIPIPKERDDRQPRPIRNYQPSPGYIYLIRADLPNDYRPYKIGYSKDVSNRMATFNVKLPFRFDLVYTLKTENMRRVEKLLHRQFQSKRVNGEWFDLSADDVEWIKNYKSD